jgi:hypothetical protein
MEEKTEALAKKPTTAAAEPVRPTKKQKELLTQRKQRIRSLNPVFAELVV